MRSLLIALSATATLLLSACLVSESSHRIYLAPDGALSWTVLQREIRSTSNTVEEREAEEQEFLQSVRHGAHPVRRAFELLDASWVDHHLLREQRPFTVWTAARFPSIVELSREILNQLGLEGDATLIRDGATRRFELVIVPPPDEHETRDDTILALAEDIGAYRIVLDEGRFVDAAGFRIEDDGRSAVPLQVDDDEAQPLRLMLAWQS